MYFFKIDLIIYIYINLETKIIIRNINNYKYMDLTKNEKIYKI